MLAVRTRSTGRGHSKVSKVPLVDLVIKSDRGEGKKGFWLILMWNDLQQLRGRGGRHLLFGIGDPVEEQTETDHVLGFA